MIGAVNYYHGMRPRRSHTFHKRKFKLTKTEQDSVDNIERIVDHGTLFFYLDFIESFKIHTDDRNFQLGAFISPKVNPFALYSRKINYSPKRYTVSDKELLSILENLKESRSILSGQKLRIYTDHKNLACKNFTNTQILRSRYRIYQR